MFIFRPPRAGAPSTARTAVPATPAAAVGEPTPLLRHLGGEFAERIAGLWPAPHAAFITAPAERRHLICLGFTLAQGGSLGVPRDALLAESTKALIARLAPAAPDGLRRALARLGESCWSATDYQRLIYVLSAGAGAKPVRHAEAVSPELVRALAALPGPLLAARVGGFGLTSHQARLLAEAFGIVQARFGQEAAAAAVLRWSGARTAEGLFELVEDDMLPPLPPPPFPGTQRLRPVATKAGIRNAAAVYRNCLRARLPTVAAGDSAIYEWLGSPSVVLEISRDPIFGWILEEAKVARNGTVPAKARPRLIADLRAMGVHVGRSAWGVRSALERASRPGWTYEPPDEDVTWRFE